MLVQIFKLVSLPLMTPTITKSGAGIHAPAESPSLPHFRISSWRD
jgi:hypothetical protein